tara:strand:- start:179 stop:553 length:375 start_codon:yes stop_codon:yes gene_type:complete
MSTLKVNTIQNTSAAHSSTPEEISQGRAKAWVNFNGTGTVAIRDSFNVSSITDHATGQYSVTYTTAMSNANYAALITTQAGSSAYGFGTGDNTQTTAALVNIFCIQHGGSTQDVSNVSAAIFGD